MAERENDTEKTPEPKKHNPESKPSSALQGFLAVVLAILVVAAVFCGVFYFILKNNLYGLGEAFRPAFQGSPILRLALPPLPEDIDPDDPKNLSDDQIKDKYIEYRKKVADLTKSLEEAQSKIAAYEADNTTLAETQAALEENKRILESIEAQQARLEEQKAALAEMIAGGDKEGFMEYYAQIDAAKAEDIYRELAKGDINRQAKTELAKPYAEMEPESAARVLSALWNKDREAALNVFEGLKPAAAALIFEEMDASLAADITKTLADRMMIK
jgi:flagellar motility protein MotE (MotC chaperone)